MEDDFFTNGLIERYEEMLESNQMNYFDSEDFCEIITYYLDVNNIEMAKKAIKYATDQHPADSSIKLKVLEFYIQIKKFNIAEVLMEELKQMHLDHPDYNICLAKYHSQKKQHHKSIAYYKIALKNSDEENYILNCIGTEYYQFLNEPENALYYFKKAFEVDLEDDFSFFSTVQCYNDLGEHLNALMFLDQCIEKEPYWEDAWFQKGLQLICLERYKEAFSAFEYAWIVNEDSVSNYIQMAYCLDKIGEYTKALELYYQALELDPNSASTYLKIGKCYLAEEKYTSAIRALQKSIQLDPQMDQTWDTLAVIYSELEDWLEAIHHQNQAIELDAENISYYKKLAYYSIEAGFLEEAAEIYSKIIKEEPKRYSNWLTLIELFISLGDFGKAIDLILGAQRKFEEPELNYFLANCYFKTRKTSLGKETLQKAVAFKPQILKEMLVYFPLLKKHLE